MTSKIFAPGFSGRRTQFMLANDPFAFQTTHVIFEREKHI
jgi:hypothetical protein